MALPLTPPIQPMLAKLVKFDIPDDAGLLFEPKWDGFRCLVFRDGDEVVLQSRTGKSFNRYFPEAAAALREALPERAVVDGELVVDRDGRLDFDALTERIHPAASRVRLLSEQTPARFITFDLLALGDEVLLDTPAARRREVLERVLTRTGSVHLTPMTPDPALARRWFEIFEGAGLDGVMGKPADSAYEPNKRVMLKFKHNRTADCVVCGMRWHKDTEPGEAVGSLMLGLHDHEGVLHFVGVVGSFSAARRRELAVELADLIPGGAEDHPWIGADEDRVRTPLAITRWRSSEQPWVPLRRERVVEVGYEHTEGGYPGRIRHTAQFVRWRPDRDPASCTYEQLEEPTGYDLSSVLRGEVRGRGFEDRR